jgi:hypothetical protein
MGDLLPLLVLAIIGVTLTALFDCVTTDDRAIRHFPKPVWLAAIMLLPCVGPILWFASGRSIRRGVPAHISSGHPAGHARIAAVLPAAEITAPRQIAPDDDPEFLARLGEMNRRARLAEFDSGLAGTGGRGGSDTHRITDSTRVGEGLRPASGSAESSRTSDEERLRRWEADLRRREERLRQRGEPPIED